MKTIVIIYTLIWYNRLFFYIKWKVLEDNMPDDKHLFDDLARVASGALGAIGSVRGDIEAKLKEAFQRFMNEMDYVTREEFNAARGLAQNAREENIELRKRIELLEKTFEKNLPKSQKINTEKKK